MSSILIHITYDKSKKKIYSTIPDLKNNIEALFDIADQDYLIQLWDADFNDWVDVDDITVLNGEEKCKLNVVLRYKSDLAIKKTCGAQDNITDSSLPSQVVPLDQIVMADVEPITPSTSSNIKKSFPLIYHLPIFPDYIQEALRNREPQCREDKFRKQIVRVIFDDLLQYGLYPGERAFSDASRALVTQYEFLQDHFINGSSFNSWVIRLRDKFKKFRSRNKQLLCSEEMQMMQTKYGSKRRAPEAQLCEIVVSEQVVKIHRKQIFITPPEDELSVMAHLLALQQELKKKEPNNAIIDEKMARTLQRRIDMVQNKCLADVLDTYPCLHIENNILKEGEITYQISASYLRAFLLRSLDKLQGIAKKKAVENLRKSYEKKERTTGTDMIYAASLLSIHLNDKAMIVDKPRESPYPYILYSGDDNIFGTLNTFTIYADYNNITSTVDIVNAVTIWFIMHWIFDIQYCKDFYGSLSFLDNYIFKKNSVKLTQKVSNFINKI